MTSLGAKSDGLKVPVDICDPSGRKLAALSSNVRRTLFKSLPPPASDMSITFCPAGPTRRMSRSPGNVRVIPPPPAAPVKSIVEGYTLAGPALSGLELGMDIELELVNERVIDSSSRIVPIPCA